MAKLQHRIVLGVKVKKKKYHEQNGYMVNFGKNVEIIKDNNKTCLWFAEKDFKEFSYGEYVTDYDSDNPDVFEGIYKLKGDNKMTKERLKLEIDSLESEIEDLQDELNEYKEQLKLIEGDK